MVKIRFSFNLISYKHCIDRQIYIQRLTLMLLLHSEKSKAVGFKSHLSLSVGVNRSSA